MFEDIVDRRMDGATTLRQCQLVQLYLLQVFDGICKKHGLRYWLDFGTLIGAMRHDGFIPWDDDLDVSMPIGDFLRFKRIVSAELPESVLFQYGKINGGVVAPIARLRDRRSFYVEAATWTDNPSGVFIDIYPMSHGLNIPYSFHKFLHCCVGTVWANVYAHTHRPTVSLGGMFLSLLKLSVWQLWYFVLMVVWRILQLFPSREWCHPPAASSRPWRLKDDWIFPLRTHKFDGCEFFVPNNADAVLTRYYGDWRKLPPESERNPDKKMKLILPDRAPKVWWAVR